MHVLCDANIFDLIYYSILYFDEAQSKLNVLNHFLSNIDCVRNWFNANAIWNASNTNLWRTISFCLFQKKWQIYLLQNENGSRNKQNNSTKLINILLLLETTTNSITLKKTIWLWAMVASKLYVHSMYYIALYSFNIRKYWLQVNWSKLIIIAEVLFL